MHRFASMTALAASGLAAATASADVFTDTFESGSSAGNWHFIQGFDIVEQSGGNPGRYLRQPAWDIFAPQARADAGPFVGDYRAMGVTGISVDAATYYRDFGPPEGFEFSLLLRDTKGTFDVDDDDYTYFVGEEVPLPGNGWKSFHFDVPSDAPDLPAGWKGGWVGDGENFRPGVTWTDVITSVDVVEFWWLDPADFAFFANWDIGIDNPAIHVIPAPGALALLGLAGVGLRRRHR